MKKTFFAYLFLGISALTIASCEKNNPINNPPPVNIADMIAGNPEFSMMESAIVRSGLETQIRNAPDITFFLADNAAFQNAGIDQTYLDNLSVDDLTALVLYHEVDHSINSSEFPLGDTITTVSNLHVFSNVNDNGIYINGIRIKTADIQATNGIVHMLEKALVPPTGSLYDFVLGNPDLSLMKAAIDKAGLASTLQNGGKLTLFAPTDAAFNAAGYMTVTDIINANQDTITRIVKDHIVPTEFFKADFIAGVILKNLQGNELVVSAIPPSISLTGSAQPVSTVTSFDLLSKNGVAQIVDNVILP